MTNRPAGLERSKGELVTNLRLDAICAHNQDVNSPKLPAPKSERRKPLSPTPALSPSTASTTPSTMPSTRKNLPAPKTENRWKEKSIRPSTKTSPNRICSSPPRLHLKPAFEDMCHDQEDMAQGKRCAGLPSGAELCCRRNLPGTGAPNRNGICGSAARREISGGGQHPSQHQMHPQPHCVELRVHEKREEVPQQ